MDLQLDSNFVPFFVFPTPSRFDLSFPACQ
uniref:Uncharacterized protein n=1 Tax=Arundo donax TaxID=35708 RepID=A0A0A9BIP7_ARUDO